MITIVVAAAVGAVGLLVLVLTFTITPERAESTAVVLGKLLELVQGMRGKAEKTTVVYEPARRAVNAEAHPAAKPVVALPTEPA